MKYLRLVLSILIAQSAGIVGSLATAPSIDSWYSTLEKPIFNPPNWIFGPVWITLFTFMGIAAWLIWEKRKTKKLSLKKNRNQQIKAALVIYAIHLVLNSLWSILFFGLNNPGLAFVEIFALQTLIVTTCILFWKINRWAGILFLPYIAWVTFAMILNYSIWQLNS